MKPWTAHLHLHRLIANTTTEQRTSQQRASFTGSRLCKRQNARASTRNHTFKITITTAALDHPRCQRLVRWPKRAIPSFPSMHFHRRFHTSIGASALPYFIRNLLRMRKACIVFCSCATCAQTSGCARLYVSTNAKSWMASNRQGPFLQLFALGYLLLSSIFYTSSCTPASFLKSSTLSAHT